MALAEGTGATETVRGSGAVKHLQRKNPTLRLG